MSAAEIKAELPRLTELERPAIRIRLVELAGGDLAAIEGAQMLDRMGRVLDALASRLGI